MAFKITLGKCSYLSRCSLNTLSNNIHLGMWPVLLWMLMILQRKSPFPALLLHVLLWASTGRAVTSAKLYTTYQSIPLLKYYMPKPTVILSICCWSLQACHIHLATYLGEKNIYLITPQNDSQELTTNTKHPTPTAFEIRNAKMVVHLMSQRLLE